MKSLAHSSLKSFLHKSESGLFKSLSLEAINGEHGCSWRTISQNGGISYSEKEEVTLKKTRTYVPFPRHLLFVLICGKFVFKGS